MTSRPSLRPEDVAALGQVIHHVRRLFHQLRQVAEDLHREVSAGERGVLIDVVQGRPRTVPDLARARPVSRQHIQKLVQSLEEKGLIQRQENPAHKTARLVVATDRGRALAEEIEIREREILRRLPLDLGRGELEATAHLLGRLRKALDEPTWRNA